MTGNTVLPMTLIFLGNRDDFHITIKAPFLKYILMDKRLGINEEKPGIYEISVQEEEEKLQQVLVAVQNDIRDKMDQLNKDQPDSEVFLHLKPTDEIIIEMPGDFRPLTLTDVPGTSEGGPIGQWMRDAVAYQKSKAHLELHMVDAGSSGVEMYIKKTEETTEEAKVSNEKGQKLLLVNKVKDDEHIEEIKKKFQNSKKDQKNVMYTSGMNLLAYQLLQTEKELLAPLSESEIANEHSAEKQKLLYRAAFGDVQSHNAFVKKWDRRRTELQEEIEEKCSACDNFALLSFLETAASQHWAKCSGRLLEEAVIHCDKKAATYSMMLYWQQGKFDKLIEELEEFLKLDHQKQMEDLKETRKYKTMKRQLEDGIKILQKGTQGWELKLLQHGWHERCVEDLMANASRTKLPRTEWSSHCQEQVCEMMVSKLFNAEEQEENTQAWFNGCHLKFVAAAGVVSILAGLLTTTVALSTGVAGALTAIMWVPPGMSSATALGFAANYIVTGASFGVRFSMSGIWGEEDLSSEPIENKILEASLKLHKENALETITKCKECKADTRDTIADLELKEAHWKMKAAALHKFAKATFGLAHAHIL